MKVETKNYNLLNFISLTEAWLHETMMSLFENKSDNIKSVLMCFFGLWICARVNHEHRKVNLIDLILEDTLDYLKICIVSNKNSNVIQHYNLILFAVYILNKNGCYDKLFNNSVKNIYNYAYSSMDVGTNLLLHELWPTKAVERFTQETVNLEEFADTLLLAPTHHAIRICNHLSAITDFGTKSDALDAGNTYLTDALSTVLYDAIRNYDLDLASSALRSFNHVNKYINPDINQATDFLLAQHKAEGQFGYYEFIVNTHPFETNQTINLHYDIYLPITLSCTWTLAEILVPSYRVFSL